MSSRLPEQKNLISISEAAKFLGVSIDTIRRWDKSGVLHSERPDGKNRHFNKAELEEIKSKQPLSISDASKKLGISATTLRRLENKGIFVPSRNGAGERVYDKDSINTFLKSDYYIKKKFSADKPPRIKKIAKPKKKVDLLSDINIEAEGVEHKSPILGLLIKYRLPEIFAALTIFALLLAIGTTNIALADIRKTHSAYSREAVLKKIAQGEQIIASDSTKETIPEASSESSEAVDGPTVEPITLDSIQALIDGTQDYKVREASQGTEQKKADGGGGPSSNNFKVILSVETNGTDFINVRENPASDAATIIQARQGDTFEMISRSMGWYKVKITQSLSGYISESFVTVRDVY